ncbi:flagellin [Anaerobiospirillum succiniciproducens]|uniref:flagellin n=1 Tax=Anaerobiospirillum succiniciproducens TaxID=13335 RepID=UPI002943DB54|nr:flagellin [Anaerobiospirillum succiniciproducens]
MNSFQFSKIGSRADAKFKENYTDKDVIKIANKAVTFQFSVASAAQVTIGLMDQMISDVDAQRADLGALQNRLESSIRNQSNVAANEADARSRIRDADFAEESANLSQQSIIQQAAASMLMQANTRPQLGLSLLG